MVPFTGAWNDEKEGSRSLWDGGKAATAQMNIKAEGLYLLLGATTPSHESFGGHCTLLMSRGVAGWFIT